ncbi:hypothetical protein B7494_g6359 [Chlorociboria aeruginascens]|nr:hypothetical protein B7494_g6359 [Chlorociboria aeruginascens]
MHVLITGAAGFIGQLLARELLNDISHTVILADIVRPPIPPGVVHPENAISVEVDLCTSAAEIVRKIALDAVFIFHGIMSSGAEADFELGMRANVDATRILLDELRATWPGVRVIYASSLAVYGRPLPGVVDDTVIPTPESSYGAQKVICETLINDYTRRGFIDGLTLRFPTVSVRPGRPTAAASSFLSGMIREPLHGEECVVPIEDRSFASWLCSPRTLVWNLVHSLTMPLSRLPRHIRQVNLPGICVTVQNMMDALEIVGGREKLDLVKEKEEPALLAILRSWPTRFDNTQATELGYIRDSSFQEAVWDYKESLKTTERIPS